MSDLLGVLQQINQANMQGMKLTDLCFGTVATADPVTVTLAGTMQPIPAAAIVLCDPVKARSVTVRDSRGDSVTVPISTALQPGERVIMMRCAHGQRFVVLSRG